MAKTIFITGATGGIGSAVAKMFASHGYRVAIGYHSSKHKAHTLMADMSGDGHIAVQCTVNKTHTVERAIAEITQHFGGLDVLVNNGGTTQFIPHHDLDALTDDIIDEIYAIHVRGTLACTRSAVPIMNEGGVIVNITSLGAESGLGSNIAYCGAKAAVNTHIKSLARVLAPKIRVIGVAPGLLKTDFVKGDGADAFFTSQEALAPMKRLASVDDVAKAIYAGVEYLPCTTGRLIQVDGGRHLA